jgi:23S rRNA pseudouridine1911/1915/1917 synthase
MNLASGNVVLTLRAESDGVRLDRWISEQRPEISRTQAQRLIDGGHVTLNAAAARSSVKIMAGDVVVLELPPRPPSTLNAETIPVKILYEDNDLLVVDKPPGLVVHPAPGHPNHTLANAILPHLTQLAGTGDWQRPGIVHRLDKDTSGLIIVAKNDLAHRELTAQFKNRQVSKVYLALVNGRVTPDVGVIEAPLGRDRSHRERMAVVDPQRGRQARTDYHVIRHVGNYSLLEVRPETGRTHQIRVHLAAIGYPVVGDKIYGTRSAFLDRQFLHAHRLRFQLPSTHQTMEFQSDLPPDLAAGLKAIDRADRSSR